MVTGLLQSAALFLDEIRTEDIINAPGYDEFNRAANRRLSPRSEFCRKGVVLMSDYEMLMLIVTISLLIIGILKEPLINK